ncbi:MULTISPECIES: HNH endonuclease [Pantoea]|jgi:hypothetical protein|uniref:HNH endonuclease n=1 Tax=Pantoea brenneri TaxID=472694 RepID=A0A7Y6TT01_9GAMM|nr:MULTISPECIES: HNH endonuclease [Pantoea]MBZ6396552.1 HNH endonuclease [Pantoea sp.]MBZ6438373.1 HNH endonuclease [Pantoea sp.]NUY42782.1 HNH endonuclease [Pantoea brenneri]NUY50415.1 HNH endonuclease [Pantoea brenneri]NUY60681.1 HNH endonuclease [Pantoea brenneri]
MKIICEFRKNYSVDENGVVRRIEPGRGTKAGQALKLNKNTNGYYKVCLMNNGKGKNFLVHRLVAEKYIPNPKNLPQVNHINGVKTDNRVENLEWCDASYNGKHSYAHLYRQRTSLPGEKNGAAKLSEKDVKRVISLREAGETLSAIAKVMGVSVSLISMISSGDRWSHLQKPSEAV